MKLVSLTWRNILKDQSTWAGRDGACLRRRELRGFGACEAHRRGQLAATVWRVDRHGAMP